MAKKNAQDKKPGKYIIVRDGKWYVRRVFPTRKRDKAGRIIYKPKVRLCVEQTEAAALALYRLIGAEYNKTLPVPIEHQTVYQNIQNYLQAKSVSIRRRTRESQESYVRLYVEHSDFGAMPITEVKASHIQAFYTSLKLKPSVLRKLHKLLSSAFAQAVKWDDLTKNPCVGVILPREQHKDLKAFDTAQAKAFIAECRKSDSNIVYEFALETGARPGEYLALKWSDVDLDNRVIHIRRSLARGFKGGGFEIQETKTKGSVRTVQFSEQLRERLIIQKQIVEDLKKDCRRRIRLPLDVHGGKRGVNYLKRKESRKVAAATLKALQDHDLVFPSEVGLPHSLNNLNRRGFKALIREIGLNENDFSLYSLRHTAATLSLVANVNIKAVAEKLGHTGVEILLSTYAHVLPNMRKEASDRLAETLY